MDSNKWLHPVWFQTTESKYFCCPSGKSKGNAVENKREVFQQHCGIVQNLKP